MKKTFLQRFFLPLCLLTLFGMLGGNYAWAVDETIVLANGTFASDQIVWEGTSCSITQAKGKSTTKPNSSYISAPRWYAQNVITFAAKTGYILDGVVVTATTNSYATVFKNSTYPTGSSVTVSGSVATITTNGDFTITMSAQSRISSIVVSYHAASTPLINLTPSSLSAFPETEKGLTVTQAFTLSGSNLSADATLAISGANADMFSVNPTSISPTDGSIADKEVTVTYAPTAAGTHEATLTISSTGAESKTIALSGKGIAPVVHHTVNWMVNGAAYTEGAPSTNVAEGSKVSALPTTPAAIGDKAFMGWTNAAISGTQDAAPAVLFTTVAEAPEVTEDVTYYAVYATQEGSAPIVSLAQTLQYDTWTFGGSTTDKGSYRMFHTDGYVESEEFDLSTLSKVVVYGGTFGGGDYNKLNIGDGTNTWKDVTVSGKSETGVNTYTDGTPLSGTGTLRITSKSGTATSNGVRISKIEIYTLQGGYTYSAYATHFATLANRNLAFSASAVDVFGSSVATPTLTGHTDGVTYESSNPEVASVDALTGAVTIGTKLGTTTITASAAKDANYYAGEASYELSVWPTSIAGLKTLITSTTPVDFKVQLNNAIITYVDGKNVYLQDANAGILMFLDGHTLTAGKSYTGVATGQAKLFNGLREITSIDWGTIAPVDASVPTALEVTVAQLQADYDKYENMYVCVKDATVTSALASKNATIAQGEGDAQKAYAVYDKKGSLGSTALSSTTSIVSVCGFPGAYNTSYQLNVFSADAVEETGYNLAVSAAGYATYFNSTKAYTLPAGVKGHIWDLSNALVNTYAPGSVVPANEPLVIEAAKGNYALMFTTTTNEAATTNVLEGTDEATALTNDPDYYYYGLSLNASSELSSVGFYWMNPTGAAFTNGAHKAYLKLAKATFSPSMAMSAFPFNGSATGIDHIATGADTTKSVYDLSGRRVNKAIKGIYIVNGKKVLVK